MKHAAFNKADTPSSESQAPQRNTRIPRKLLVLAATALFLLLAGCDLSYSGTPTAQPAPTSQVSPTSPGLPSGSDAQGQGTPAARSTVARLVALAPTQAPRVQTVPTLMPAASPTRVSLKPRYVFPVQPAAIANYGPYHHDYPAADIFSPVTSRFVAPTDGVVDYVTTKDVWDSKVDDPATRGGLSVAIIGDDGVRYYGSHLSAVQAGIVVGLRVTAGQTLGNIGHSGDAISTPTHLHFGISPPTTATDWKVRRGTIAPYKYLTAWEAGTQLRPTLK